MIHFKYDILITINKIIIKSLQLYRGFFYAFYLIVYIMLLNVFNIAIYVFVF